MLHVLIVLAIAAGVGLLIGLCGFLLTLYRGPSRMDDE